MTASAGVLPRCFFAFLVFAGVAGLGVPATDEPEPQPDPEGSTSHAAVLAVPTPSRNHVEAGDLKGTLLSDAGSPMPAHTTLPHEVQQCLRLVLSPVRHSVASFFDRVSYRTTGPPLQTF